MISPTIYMKHVHYDKAIARSIINLSANERRIIWIVLAKIITTKYFLPENHYFYIKSYDYSKLCGLDLNGSYKILKECAQSLKTKNVTIYDSITSKTINTFSFLDSIHYEEKQGYVKLILSKDILPYVSGLTHNYTTQKFSYSLILKNNASALYSFLNAQISAGFTKSTIIYLKDLKASLGLKEGTYLTYNMFDTFFKRTVKEVILKTEFQKITMKSAKKESRTIVAVHIQYEYAED